MASMTGKSISDDDNVINKEASPPNDASPQRDAAHVENTTDGGEIRVNTELPLLIPKRKAGSTGKDLEKDRSIRFYEHFYKIMV